MTEVDELLSALAAIGEDGCSAERKRDVRSPFPDAGFWGNERSVQQLWSSTDAEIRSVGRGLRELLLNSSCKMELATLYFHMLASKDAPALRDNFLSARRPAAAADDGEDGEPAEEPAVFSWPQMQEMLAAARSVCTSQLLEGRTEAIDTAFEQCAAVMRMSLAHKEGKTPRAKEVAKTAGEVLQQLMEVNCVQRPEIAIQLLHKLTPGLYGCTAMPRPNDTIRPQTSILEATMGILGRTPDATRHLCIPIFQNALQRAPDKAPLRNNLATGCAMAWSTFGTAIACQILHFLGMLTYGGEPGMRKLGIQCMEEMAISALENPCDELEDADNKLLAGVKPEEFVLGLCVQRCADVSHAVSSRAMSAIFKFSTKLLSVAESDDSAAGSSQHAHHAARAAWSRERLKALADILCGEHALLLDEERLDLWNAEVDAAEGAEEGSDEEGGGNARGGALGNGGASTSKGGRGQTNRKRNRSTRGQSSEAGAEDQDEVMADDDAAPALPDQVCLFTWMSRSESEQPAPTPVAGPSTATTPASNEASNAAQGSGAIPLTPIGDLPTGGSEPSAGAAATGAAAGGAGTSAAAPATAAPAAAAAPTPGAAAAPQEEGPLAAPHILDMLAAQAVDGRAAARKSAVQLAGSAIALLRVAEAPAALLREAHERVLPLLQRLAADVSVSVRRAVLDATIALMQNRGARVEGVPGGDAWVKVWARIVLPLVQDAEPTVFDAAINEVMTRMIKPAADMRLDSAAPSERTLSHIAALRPFIAAACGEYTVHSTYLHRVVSNVSKQAISKQSQGQEQIKRTLGQVVHAYQGLLGGSAAFGTLNQKERSFCWSMVSEACSAGARGASATEFMMDSFVSAWKKLDAWVAPAAPEGGVGGGDAGRATVDMIEAQKAKNELQTEAAAVCSALCTALEQLSDEDGTLLLTEAFKRLDACQTDCVIIAPLCRLATFLTLGRQLQPEAPEGVAFGRGGWQVAIHKSCQQHIIACLEHLADVPAGPVAPHTASLVDRATHAIYTCGRLSLECGKLPTQSALHAIQALCMPSHLQRHAATLSPKLTPGCSSRQLGVPSVLQAHAWLALGSMSLVDEPLCRNTTPLLVSELKRNASPAVRANAMLALSDIAAIQTMLVDVHLKEITVAVRDPHPLLRKQALSLLAGLLQKEFLKWRGPLFVQYLLSLVDESPTVRAMAHHLVSEAMVKSPALAHTHFLEVLCVLNDALDVWTALRRRSPVAGSQGASSSQAACASQAGAATGGGFGSQGWQTFGMASKTPGSLLGDVSGVNKGAQSRRFVIYKALLKTMQPQYKLALVEKLCEDVLGTAAEGGLPLDGCCHGVIADALGVIALPDLQISAKSMTSGEDADGDEGGEGGSQAATSQMVKMTGALAAVKKNMLDKMVPILATLKGTLEEAMHPLQRDTLNCLVRLYTEHRPDMEELLVNRSQLAAEIRYNAQERLKAKKDKTKSRKKLTASTTAGPRTAAPQRTPPPSPWHHLNTADLPNVTPLPGAPNMFCGSDVAAAAAARTHAGNATATATGATPTNRARPPFSPVQFQAFPQCAPDADETPRFDTLLADGRQPRTAAGLTLAPGAAPTGATRKSLRTPVMGATGLRKDSSAPGLTTGLPVTAAAMKTGTSNKSGASLRSRGTNQTNLSGADEDGDDEDKGNNGNNENRQPRGSGGLGDMPDKAYVEKLRERSRRMSGVSTEGRDPVVRINTKEPDSG